MNKTLKKTLSIILTILMIVTAMPFAFAAGAEDLTVSLSSSTTVTLKDTDADSYYEIGTVNELKAFAQAVNTIDPAINGELVNDIDFNPGLTFRHDEDTWLYEFSLNGEYYYLGSRYPGKPIENGNTQFDTTPSLGHQWYIFKDGLYELCSFSPTIAFTSWTTPIGNDGVYYAGIFDGHNYAVKNIYARNAGLTWIGLFSVVDSTGVVKNVGVENSFFFSDGTCGMIAGANKGQISNCYSTGIIYKDGLMSSLGITESNLNIVKNCYSLVGTGHMHGDSGRGYPVTKTDEQFKSGEIAYLLQGEQTEHVWGQKIGTDDYPVLGGEKVYYGYTTCSDTEKKYTNDANASDEAVPHTYSDGACTVCGGTCETLGHVIENGICTVCGKAGTCGADGDNLTWELDADGTLTISGTGAMADGTPWKSNANSVKKVVIEDGVTTIGASAFAWCQALADITIPDSVTSIGSRAFSWCHSLSTLTIPDSVTNIDAYAFADGGIVSIEFPDSITNINDNMFNWCTALRNVTIPESVTSIGNSAFYFCLNLETIEIPVSVTSIGTDAFTQCQKLTTVTVPCTWDGTLYTFDSAVTVNKVHRYTDSVCDYCGCDCPHESYTDSICDACGEVCTHESYTDGICDTCGYECPHENITESVCDICGYVEKFSMRIYWGGDKYTDFTVPYGANLMEVITTAEKEGKLLSKGDEMRIVNDKTNGIYYITGAYIFRTGSYITNTDIMPANDIQVTQAQYTYGWVATWDEEDNVRWRYSAKSGTLNEGWHYIEEDYDDVDGGARYYLEPVTTYFGGTLIVRAEGITEIDGKHYYFDELGRFMESFTGIHKGYYFENGVEVVTKAVDNKDGTTHRIVCAEHENCGVVFMAEEEHNIVNDACGDGCGYEYDKPADPTPDTPDEPDVPDEPEQSEEPTDKACDHICHSKNALIKVLWKIISFFYRLFNIQQYCDCGAIHYDAPVFG